MTLTAITELVKRTKPSGIIPIKEATVVNMASVTFPLVASTCDKYMMIPIGIIKTDTIFNNFSKECIMTEFIFFSYLASFDIFET